MPMNFTRRLLLQGASVSAILASTREASAWIHGGGTSFNGGLTQVNALNAQAGGNFTFMNFMKSGQEWSYRAPPTNPSAPQQPILELDADGYPTSIVAGTTGITTVLFIPNATEYSGTWVLKWDGTGTSGIAGFSATITLTNSNRVEFTNNDTTAGGTRVVVNITATTTAPNQLKNLVLCRIGDETGLAAGQQFFPDHLAIMRSARPGVIRSLGWGGGFNGTNDSMATTWATRRSKTYITYEGGIYNPTWYGGTTTNSGSDYTLAFGGFSLANKAIVQLTFNANTPQSGQPTVTFTTIIGNPIPITFTAHGLSANNAIAFGTGLPSALTAATTYFIKTVIDANTFTVSATRGGTVINASASTSGSCASCSIPMININSTGFVPITGNGNIPVPNNPFVGFNTQLPVAGPVATMVYDSTIGYFILAMINGNFVNGAPPEVFADYCAAIGAHPHIVSPFLSMEPLSDYMTSWVTYIKSTYPWMKPRAEPPNECWNNSAGFLSTTYAQSLSFVLWGTSQDTHNAYGKWCSVLGQAISAIYGNDRTKYSMICSVQTAVFNTTSAPGAAQDARLKSTLYVSVNGGLPAYNWVDRVCGANYYSPSERFTCQELIDAYAYVVTNAGNPSAQLTIANNYASSASVATGNVPFTLAYEDACFGNIKTWAQGMPGGNTIAGITAYEGGWSPDYLQGNWSTNITGATKANPCVLTLATTSQNSENSGMTGNPAVVGMSVTPSGVVGMTQLNGNTYTVTAVSGNLVTINVDSSAFTTYSSAGLLTYVNSQTYSNTLRTAGGNSTQGGTLNTAMYTIFAAHASSGFVAEYPSNFFYFGSGSVWPVVQPDIYGTLTPQWNSIVAEN